jgi:GABA(A) receptor-associated protein
MSNQKKFRQNFTFLERISEAKKVLDKYPQKLPLIIENGNSKYNIDKNKFLVPRDMKFAELMNIIRKKINMQPHEALFLLVDNVIPSNNEMIETLYYKYKNKDLFLYITYSTENVFG